MNALPLRILCVAAVSLVTAFPTRAKSDSDPIHQRAWLGGSFKVAKAGGSQSSSEVGAFPRELQPTHRSGLLLCELATNTPAALGGLRVGDLIVEVNRKPVRSLRALVASLDERQPGDALPLRIYRDGEILELAPALGRESFRRKRTFTVGLLFSSKVDVVPNPNFSLVAAGFQRRAERLELQSPETQFLLRHRASDDPDSGATREGWQAWLAVVAFGSHKQILSQEL